MAAEQEPGGRPLAGVPAERYGVLFDNAPLAMLEVNLGDGPPTILAANARSGQIYRCAPDELVGRPLDLLFADGSAGRLERVLAAVAGGQTAVMETGQVRLDGEAFVARVHLAPLRGPDGPQAILMVDDISAECQRRDDLAAIDRDRRRIAHEIHDGLAQSLYALRLRAVRWSILLDSEPERLRAELGAMVVDLKDDIREARRAIFALRPVRLDEVGLEASMHSLVEELGLQYELVVDFEVRGRPKLPQAQELPLLRALQEAVNNVGRHARARQVTVLLDGSHPGETVLAVRDDGVGFEPALATAADVPGHYGLRQMRERIGAYGGNVVVDSRPGAGTEIRVHLPRPEGEP